MRKIKKFFWRRWRQQGMPFALRALLVRHAIKATPAALVAQYLRSRGIPATTGGQGYCHTCGSHHRTWLAVRWQGYRITFPVSCCGVHWLSGKIRKVGGAPATPGKGG